MDLALTPLYRENLRKVMLMCKGKMSSLLLEGDHLIDYIFMIIRYSTRSNRPSIRVYYENESIRYEWSDRAEGIK